jgi:hypothetical protein
MSTLQKHDKYPSPKIAMPLHVLVIRETSPSWEQFDLMYNQCKAWQTARCKAEQAVGSMPFPYNHPALAKPTSKAAIGQGMGVSLLQAGKNHPCLMGTFIMPTPLTPDERVELNEILQKRQAELYKWMSETKHDGVVHTSLWDK